jgi:hypothetical protein
MYELHHEVEGLAKTDELAAGWTLEHHMALQAAIYGSLSPPKEFG